jgi:hypothetical protein
MNFCRYFTHFLTDVHETGHSEPHISLFSIFSFALGAVKTHPLLNGVNEVLPIVSTFIVRYRLYSVHWMGVESLQNPDDADAVVSETSLEPHVSLTVWKYCIGQKNLHV